MKMRTLLIPILLCSTASFAQEDSVMIKRISDHIMLHGKCYNDLKILCKTIGNRLSGTPAAAKAVNWAQKALTEAGADKVYLQPVNVPVWKRGSEQLLLPVGKTGVYEKVPVLSLGNSEGTGGKWLEAPIIMVNDFEEFAKLSKEEVKGRIVFFNYHFRQEVNNPFQEYGRAGAYRWSGANVASAKHAAGIIIRSVSTGIDDYPHTGSMRYADSVKPIPAVAIGNLTADKLEAQCLKHKNLSAKLQSNCHLEKETARSYNVIGEIKGTEHPEDIIVVGGHLDSWDVGEGAHDDGAGCVQSIEVARTLKALHIRPRYTIRVVLFMNEENGLRGGVAYADSAKAHKENHILAIESDAGGFSPRGIGLEMPETDKEKIRKFRSLFLPYGVYNFEEDEGGADISPLRAQNVPEAGLLPDPQRYFDIHHTNADVFEQVNNRELKLGAVTLTGLVYLIDKYGL